MSAEITLYMCNIYLNSLELLKKYLNGTRERCVFSRGIVIALNLLNKIKLKDGIGFLKMNPDHVEEFL